MTPVGVNNKIDQSPRGHRSDFLETDCSRIRVNLPDGQAEVPGRRKMPAVGVELQPPNPADLGVQQSAFLPGEGVPNPDFVPPISRRQESSVGGEGDRLDRSLVPRAGVQQGAGLHVPYLQRPVLGYRREPEAVGAKGHSRYARLVARQVALFGRRVNGPAEEILARRRNGQQEPSVGAKIKPGGARRRFDRRRQSVGMERPHLGVSLLQTGRGHQVAEGMDRYVRDNAAPSESVQRQSGHRPNDGSLFTPGYKELAVWSELQ